VNIKKQVSAFSPLPYRTENMKIGNVEIQNGLFLAPMAGVTDKAFRYMCKKYGAGATVTEMVSAKAVTFGDKKTGKIAAIYDEDRPCALQIFGSEPEIMAKAAEMLVDEYKPEIIDINMGCPAPKIVNNGEGSALMKNPLLAHDIVKNVVSTVGGKSVRVPQRAMMPPCVLPTQRLWISSAVVAVRGIPSAAAFAARKPSSRAFFSFFSASYLISKRGLSFTPASRAAKSAEIEVMPSST